MKQKKDNIEQKIDKTVNWFKIGTGFEGTKDGKLLIQQRRQKNQKKLIKFKHLALPDVLGEKEK